MIALCLYSADEFNCVLLFRTRSYVDILKSTLTRFEKEFCFGLSTVPGTYFQLTWIFILHSLFSVRSCFLLLFYPTGIYLRHNNKHNNDHVQNRQVTTQ